MGTLTDFYQAPGSIPGVESLDQEDDKRLGSSRRSRLKQIA